MPRIILLAWLFLTISYSSTARAELLVLEPSPEVLGFVDALKIQLTPERIEVVNEPRLSARESLEQRPEVLAVVWFAEREVYLLLQRNTTEAHVFQLGDGAAAERSLALQLAHLYMQALEEQRSRLPAPEQVEPSLLPPAAQPLKPPAHPQRWRVGVTAGSRFMGEVPRFEAALELGYSIALGSLQFEPLLAMGYTLPSSHQPAAEASVGSTVDIEQYSPAVGLALLRRTSRFGMGVSLRGRVQHHRASSKAANGNSTSHNMNTVALASLLTGDLRLTENLWPASLWIRGALGAELDPRRPRYQLNGHSVYAPDFWALEFAVQLFTLF